MLAGTLAGTGNAGRKIVLQNNPWPYTQGFKNASNEQLTNAQGGFAFPLLGVLFNSQYRVRLPERPAVVEPDRHGRREVLVHTHVSKHRVKRGRRVRFSGSISPARPGAQIAFQKKTKSGRWVTIDGTVIRSGGKYRQRVKIRRGGSLPRLDGRRRSPVHGQPRPHYPPAQLPLRQSRDAAPLPGGGAA